MSKMFNFYVLHNNTKILSYLSNKITVDFNRCGGNGALSIKLDCYVSVNFSSAPTRTSQRTMVQKDHRRDKNVRSSSSKTSQLSDFSQNRDVPTNFVKILNMKLLAHENPSSGSRVVPCGHTA